MTALHLDRSRLLWRTRGYRWDYVFLVRPKLPGVPGWLGVFEHVFPNDRAPSEGIQYSRGRLRARPLGQSEISYPFVASALTDPTRRDFASRRIQHFFVYLPSNDDELSEVERDWAKGLLEALGPTIETVFALERGEGESPTVFSERLLEAVDAALPEQLEVTAAAGATGWEELPDLVLPDEAEEEKKKQAARSKATGSDTATGVGDDRVGNPASRDSLGGAVLSRENAPEEAGRQLGFFQSVKNAWSPPAARIPKDIEDMIAVDGLDKTIELLEQQLKLLRRRRWQR